MSGSSHWTHEKAFSNPGNNESLSLTGDLNKGNHWVLNYEDIKVSTIAWNSKHKKKHPLAHIVTRTKE